MRYDNYRLIILTCVLFLLTITEVTIASAAQYTYDTLDRLIKVEYDNGTVIQYTYDAVGNRLTQEVQAFSGVSASSENRGPASTSVPLPTTSPVSATSKAATLGGASGATPAPAWFTLLTKIRLATSESDLENLQVEIRAFLDQVAFSSEEKSRYQKLAARELAARADFIQRTAAAGGKRAGTASPAVTPREQDSAAAPRRHKIVQEQGKIYTSGPGKRDRRKPSPDGDSPAEEGIW